MLGRNTVIKLSLRCRDNLTAEYGAGFSRQNLFHMIRFVEAWPEQAQMSVLAQQLGWSRFKEILYLENELAASSMPRCADSSGGASARYAITLAA
jgi:hypothetical protein